MHLPPSRRHCPLFLGSFHRILVFLPKPLLGKQAHENYQSILLSLQEPSLVLLTCVLINRQHYHVDYLLCEQTWSQITEASESSGMSSRQHPVETSNVSFSGQFLGQMERPTDMVGTTSGPVLPPKPLFWWSSTSWGRKQQGSIHSINFVEKYGPNTIITGINVYNEWARVVWVLENGGSL